MNISFKLPTPIPLLVILTILLFILYFNLGILQIEDNAVFAQSISWEAKKNLPVDLGELSAASVNGAVYVFLGRTTSGNNPNMYKYDASLNSWQTLAGPTVGSKLNHAPAEVIGEKIYVPGGLEPESSQLLIYDASANTWSLGSPINKAGVPFTVGSSSTGVINGKLYLAGGIHAGATVTNTFVYDPTTNIWTELAPMKQGRNHAAGVAYNGKFYVFGGRCCGGNTVSNGTRTVQIYDPATNIWDDTSAQLMPTARGGMGNAVEANGELIVIGGEGGGPSNGTFPNVEGYNPATNTWRSLPNLPTPRHGFYPVILNGTIYVAGGGTNAGTSASSINESYYIGGETPPPSPTPTSVPTPTPTPIPGEHGLVGTYYNNDDFTNLVFTRIDPQIDFNWGSGSPDTAIDPNTFSIRWSGYVIPNFSENYTFYAYTNDGVRLWINEVLVVDAWFDHVGEYSGSISLNAGQSYSVIMEYYEKNNTSLAKLSWSSLSTPKQVVPLSNLVTSPGASSSPTPTPSSTPIPTPTPIVSPTPTPTPTPTPIPTTTPSPTPSPTPGSNQQITSLTLINAETNLPVPGYDPLTNGAILNLSSLPTTNLNIRANVNTSDVGSVRFDYDNIFNFRTENVAPFALAGDKGGNYSSWTPSVGSHFVSAIPFSKGGANGIQGVGLTISFDVVNQ